MTEHMRDYATRYFTTLDRVARCTEVRDQSGVAIELDDAISSFMQLVRETSAAGGKLMLIGNGGSASIASHIAIDFVRNRCINAMAFNDPMFLTCLSNDLGYENAFAFQIERFCEANDILIAISSSGRSANILNAVAAARRRNARVITFSGFGDRNPLRQLGDLNFYVPSSQYGFVELIHCSLCHCVIDGLMNVPTN